jgi:hypothetical protein
MVMGDARLKTVPNMELTCVLHVLMAIIYNLDNSARSMISIVSATTPMETARPANLLMLLVATEIV